MSWLRVTVICLGLLAAQLTMLGATEEYQVADGSTYRGEAGSFNEYGVVIKLAVGGFTDRIPYGRLTEETLRKLVKVPQAKEYVEPFLEPAPGDRPKPQAKKIVVKPVTRVERPTERYSVISALMTPGGFAFLGALYLANLYAGFAVAGFRHRPAAMLCAVSAVLPFVGPLIFLAMPAGEYEASSVDESAEGAGASLESVNPMASANPPPGQSNLSLAAAASQAGGDQVGPAVYNRGDTTFNRKFFETKFPGFFRMVAGEAEKNLVMVVKTGREEYVAKRVSRISSTEMHLQLLKTGAPEVSVTFGDIVQVQIRHKDAKA